MRTYSVTRKAADPMDCERYTFNSLSVATRRYYRLLHRHKGDHVILAECGQLPDMPEAIIAQEFGGRTTP